MQTIIKQELINDFIKLGLEKGDVGKIGEAESRLMSQVELVDYSISWIEQNRR